ncbi:hypothetical protein GCM10022221_13250 [Actinocorallia aurea]
MALVRKGSRGITVDGLDYRWTVRRKMTYCQGSEWGPLTFAVEHSERVGSVLAVSVPCAHPRSWIGGRSMTVRPALVASSIRTALARGWTPLRPGSAFHLELEEQDLPDDAVWFIAAI